MVYVDVVRAGNKTFYYLGKTVRVGPNKWKKIRIKFGTTKPSKKQIAEKLKELRLEEYMVYNEDYIDADKLEFIDDLKDVYQNRLKTEPKAVVENEEFDFLIRFIYNSNAIEGNRLTLRDTYVVIKERQIPQGAPPRDYNEALNGKEAVDFMKDYDGKLTVEFMERLNEILTKNTGVVYPGKIRFFPVKIKETTFTPPSEKEVQGLLKDMIKYYYENKRRLHPFVLACLMHAKFVEIRPFEDGNGRTGRLLMNWVLMKAGHPGIVIPVRHRETYYQAISLHNAKKYGEYCSKMFELVFGPPGHGAQGFSVFADKSADNPIFEYLAGKPKGLTVADLGCRSGDFLAFLSKHFEKIVAVSPFEAVLKRAKEAHPEITNVDYMNIDMRNLRPLYGKVDMAVSANSIAPETVSDVEKMFQEVYKSLKRGGEFVAIIPSAEATMHLALLEHQKLVDAGVDDGEAMKQIEKIFEGDRQFNILGLQRDNETVPRQKYCFGFEIPWRLERAGFKSFKIKKIRYSWEYAKHHDYGYFPRHERIWDWFVVAKK